MQTHDQPVPIDAEPAVLLIDAAEKESAGVNVVVRKALSVIGLRPQQKIARCHRRHIDEVLPCRRQVGATAALALAGRPVSVTRQRGAMAFGPYRGFVTVHPSYLLRLPREDAAGQYKAFVDDLRAVRALTE